MSKQLTPLEAFDELHCVAYGMKAYDKHTIECENIIENELKEKEQQDKILLKSYDIENLKDLKDFIKECQELDKKCCEMDEVLQIIKEKRVNVFWLMECIYCFMNALEKYNESVLCDIDCLTQEDFDLLKETLL